MRVWSWISPMHQRAVHGRSPDRSSVVPTGCSPEWPNCHQTSTSDASSTDGIDARPFLPSAFRPDRQARPGHWPERSCLPQAWFPLSDPCRFQCLSGRGCGRRELTHGGGASCRGAHGPLTELNPAVGELGLVHQPFHPFGFLRADASVLLMPGS